MIFRQASDLDRAKYALAGRKRRLQVGQFVPIQKPEARYNRCDEFHAEYVALQRVEGKWCFDQFYWKPAKPING